MPYIIKEDRWPLEHLIIQLGDRINDPAKLNYVISCLAHKLARRGGNYSAYNAVIGALECAKLEMYRRLVAPYEDKKIIENGDL
jgi:hypothetical protein